MDIKYAHIFKIQFLISILVLIIGNASIVFAQDQDFDKLIKNANQLYIEKQYQESIELYEKVVISGYQSAKLYYNIGNAYYKLNNYPKAILFYERARLLEPDNHKVIHNLKFAQQHIKDQIDVIPNEGIGMVFKKMVNTYTSKSWSYISIVFFNLALLLFLVFLFNSKLSIKKASFIISILFIVISLTSLFFASNQYNNMVNNKTAIIMAPVSIAKSSPDKGSTDLFRIHEGLKVKVQDKSGDWVEIRLADGRIGWIPTKELEQI